MNIQEFVKLKQNANTLEEIGNAMDLVNSCNTIHSEKIRNHYYDELDRKYYEKMLDE